jgi:hypothetical protein
MATCARCIHYDLPGSIFPCGECNHNNENAEKSYFVAADEGPIEYAQPEQAENHDPFKDLEVTSKWNTGKTALDVTFTPKGKSALETQVGGDHYKDLAIQPAVYSTKNNLGFLAGTVVKYISRYKNKNGKQDLEKIKHVCDLLIALEYGDEK